jgi:hypothetical protein
MLIARLGGYRRHGAWAQQLYMLGAKLDAYGVVLARLAYLAGDVRAH